MLLAAGELPVRPSSSTCSWRCRTRTAARTAFELARDARRAGLAGPARAGRALAQGPAQARGPDRRAVRGDRRRERHATSLKDMESGEQHELSSRRRDPDDPARRAGCREARPRPNDYRDAWCGELTAERADTAGARRRLGAPPPRPRRPDLHRPARPLGDRPARVPPRDRARGARGARTRCAPRT